MILTVPGDKSITQRALIFATLANGESRLSNLLAGGDASSTAGALRALGGRFGTLPSDGSTLRVTGLGLRGLQPPAQALDLGNSGTGARLMMGVLAACPFESVMTGDASLRSRPMKRVTDPLSSMGARFEALESPGRLPIRIEGPVLRPVSFDSPVASAQVKSALLLAGLVGGVSATVTEPGRSRDHTERMLRQVGVGVQESSFGTRWRVDLADHPRSLPPLDFRIPGDFSSAAFLLAAGLLGVASEPVTLDGVGVNPTRTGLLPLLRRMGASVLVEGGTDDGREPVAALTVSASELRGIEVGADDVLPAIDEIPALVVLAARAHGVTRITGAGELRVKESDRIRALVQGLRALGVEADELEDGLVLEGNQRILRGTVQTHQDHRIAMAFGLLGALPGNDVRVEDPESADVSFPRFWETLAQLAARTPRGTAPQSGATPVGEPPRDPAHATVVTLDGPAGSGKSSTAREVARRLGYRHLDSGALYRALTHALLGAGIAPEGWSALTADDLSRFDIRVATGPDERLTVLMEGRALDDAELRGREVTAHVSAVAGLPAVRSWLLQRQREAGKQGRLVAEGRDMGTVVFPDAGVKIFLVADLEERARRRLREHGVENPGEPQVREEIELIRNRDKRDMERAVSPLRRALDAWVLDTTGMAFEAQVEAIVKKVRERFAGPPPSA